MAEIAPILRVIEWGTKLSLNLYGFSTSLPILEEARDIIGLAKEVVAFDVVLKQVIVTYKEKDSIPSEEAYTVIKDILKQCQDIFREIEELVPPGKSKDDQVSSSPFTPVQEWIWTASSTIKGQCLSTSLAALKATLSVMLQSFYTVRVIRAFRDQQISSNGTQFNVETEREQLEALIIDQQMIILKVYEIYNGTHSLENMNCEHLRPTANMSLARRGDQACRLFVLKQFQERSLVNLYPIPPENERLALVRGLAVPHIEDILAKWTRLPEIEADFRKFQAGYESSEREEMTEFRKRQQPQVESVISEQDAQYLKDSNDRMTSGTFQSPMLQRPIFTNPIFNGHSSVPVNIPLRNPDHSHPLTPESSNAILSPKKPANHTTPLPDSPRSSISSTVHTQAAAVAKLDVLEHHDHDLGIPWRICLPEQYWSFIDGRQVEGNTRIPLEHLRNNRSAWTEITAAWVCKPALEAGRYDFQSIQKEVRHGKNESNTRLEPCWTISRALTYVEVKELVEHTIQIFRDRENRKRVSLNPYPQVRTTRSIDRSLNLPRTPTSPSYNYQEFASSPRQQYQQPSQLIQPQQAPPLSSRDWQYHSQYQQPPNTAPRLHRAETAPAPRRQSDDRYGYESDSSDPDDRVRSRRTSSGSGSTRYSKSDRRGSKTLGTMARYGGAGVLLEKLVDVLT
ncbi:hypothetical protein M501DRAFT_925018 [Patellaria atrata CBS 101060]|uniref:Uncharacterized protein n=1 Tax=Patellaria atrata CBS 101060 TaxID=1346257 RepID=A0A9P4SHD2_9PEZI|nr:hypothetical protein M501DRAFT_925018 [Patellaria atrata CBS 101060]